MTRRTLALICSAALVMAVAACSRPGTDESHEAGALERNAAGTGLQDGRGPHGPRGAGGGGRRGRGWSASTSVRLTGRERLSVEIETARAVFMPMSSSLQATGKVFAHQLRKAIVSYPFPARVSRIHVRPGDWVEAGQALVTLQSEAVGQAKSEYFKALADHELARSSLEREKRLFDRGAGAGKNLQAAEAELKVAQAGLEAAEKKLHVLGFTEAQVAAAASNHEVDPLISLFAPIAGKVVDDRLVLGAMVDQTTEILTVLDPRVLRVDADIYERDIAKVRTGQRVEVTVPSYPELVFVGTIRYVGDVLKEDTRTVTVRTEVDNEGLKLKPGMFASLRIVHGEEARVLAVPEEAVLDDGDRKMVFLSRDGAFVPRVVVTGPKIDGHVSVLEGLAEGDEVVTAGGYQLKSKLYDDVLKSGVH